MRSLTLPQATGLFMAALLLHLADHLRRGLDASQAAVQVLGNLQLAFALVVVLLVVRRHPAAPSAAAALGLLSAIGFSAAHVLPHWGPLSDAFSGTDPAPGVTWFSWVTALAEIGAGVVLGVTALRVRAAAASAPASSA